jgi:hypothetical protein
MLERTMKTQWGTMQAICRPIPISSVPGIQLVIQNVMNKMVRGGEGGDFP